MVSLAAGLGRQHLAAWEDSWGRFGDQQDDSKGTGERSCAAAALELSQAGCRLVGLCVHPGTLKHLAVPAATCMCFPPRAANLLFVWREHFIWRALASAASFHAQCSEIKGCSFPRPLLNASGLLELVR